MRKSLILVFLAVAVVVMFFLSSGTGAVPDEQTDHATEEPPEDFIPSEEINADDAVSFPVDI